MVLQVEQVWYFLCLSVHDRENNVKKPTHTHTHTHTLTRTHTVKHTYTHMHTHTHAYTHSDGDRRKFARTDKHMHTHTACIFNASSIRNEKIYSSHLDPPPLPEIWQGSVLCYITCISQPVGLSRSLYLVMV